jgi:hypothetical protein
MTNNNIDDLRAPESRVDCNIKTGWRSGSASDVLRPNDRHCIAEMPRLSMDSQKRKKTPIASGCLDYFPDALAAVAELSWEGNRKHNPGQPLFWNRSKSSDEADCLIRHFVERGTVDTDGIRHSVKVAWRALALLQKELEAENGLPISRGSRAS